MGLRWIGRAVRGALGGVLSGSPVSAITGAIAGAVGTPPSPVFIEPPVVVPNAPPPMATSWAPPMLQQNAFPGGFQPAMAVLPRLPQAGRMAGVAVGTAARYARAAAAWIRRNPAWATTIGLAGVEQMLRSGQLPMPKRRRARGITGTELRNFRRVTKFLTKYTPAVRRMATTQAVRRGR